MDFLLFLPVLVFSIVVHEVAHAWVARREGDPTADRLGRITLNPIPHLDAMGSVILPAILHFTGASFLFGWAKPVPVDPRNFRDPVWSDIRVSLAGVVSNLILAALCTPLVLVLLRAQDLTGVTAFSALADAAYFGIQINLVLAIFNLLPIPPLDGSHVVGHMLPESLRPGYQALGRYGLLVLMGVFILAPGLISAVLFPPIRMLMDIANSVIQAGL